MNHLSDQFLRQFLEDIKRDNDIPDSLKEKLDDLYSTKKITKGDNLKNLLSASEINNEDSKN